MSRLPTDGELKALFRQLVKAAGGVEAAGVELGVAHQRVSLLQSPNAPDIPNLRQIMALEAVVGRAIVTAGLARIIEGEADESLRDAMVETVQAVGEALGAVHAMDADGVRTEAEVRAVQTLTQKALREAQDAATAAARLSATGIRGERP
jgi:hypothetical protein